MSRPRRFPHHHIYIWRLVLGWYSKMGSSRETKTGWYIRPGLAMTTAHAYEPEVTQP